MKKKAYHAVVVLGMVIGLFCEALRQDVIVTKNAKEVIKNNVDYIGMEESKFFESILPDTESSQMVFFETEISKIESFEIETSEVIMPETEMEEISESKEDNSNGEELSVWSGKYKFFEATPATTDPSVNIIMDHKIEIYQDAQGKYYADIEIRGQTTSIVIRADVYGDSQKISLFFKEFLPGNYITWFEKEPEKELISFRKDDVTAEIYTYWGQLQPMRYDNMESGKIYFEKVKED